MNRDQVKSLVTRFNGLQADRSAFVNHWQEIADLVSPTGTRFTGENVQQGILKNEEVYDSTGIHSNELLSAGFFSMLTSPTTPWFSIQTADAELSKDREVKIWLADVTKIMLYEIQRPQTGFATAQHEFYMDYNPYGNAVLFVTERSDFSSLLFYTLPLNECFFLENDEGFITSLFRSYRRTAPQLAEKFGVEALSEPMRKALEAEKFQDKFNIIHVIMPNTEANRHGIKSTDLPYLSIYIETDSLHVLQESGFEEQPFMAARFYKAPHEIYGRGPGSTALPDLKMLQQIVKTTIRGAQKMVDPPMQMPDEGFLHPLRMNPAGINYYRSGSQDRAEPVKTGGQPLLGEELAQGVRNRIREIFYVDQLQLNQGPQMTATEVMQRTEEKLRIMGPIVGRNQSEQLNPMLIRIFGILRRAGKLPPPPQAILASKAKLKIAFTSPISKAQEQVAATNLMRTMQVLTPFAATNPQTMNIFDTDYISRSLGDMYSLDPRFFRTKEDLAAEQQQQQQMQAQLQQAQLAKDGGIGMSAMADAGKTLGETNLSALTGVIQ